MMDRHLGTFHHGPILDRENRTSFTLATLEGHGFMLDVAVNIMRTTFRTVQTIRSTDRLDASQGRIFILEHIHYLNSVMPSRSFLPSVFTIHADSRNCDFAD